MVYKSNEEIPYTGKVSIFWENDQLKEEGLYRDGVRSGLWKYWYSDGQLSSKGIFRNNLKTGVWLEFYENGNKKMQTIYRNGLKNGKQINWTFDGIRLASLAIKVEKEMVLLKHGTKMEEKSLQVVLLMVLRMEKLLNGMKVDKNIESKILVMGKKTD